MPYMKILNGHTDTYGVFKYLFFDKKTGERRALSVDGINMISETWTELAHEMEQLRKENDSQEYIDMYKNCKRKRMTYKHIIISPDPKDNISELEFRNFICDYLDLAFNSHFQIAVICHNDNGILHAHCIVNSINFDENKRLSTYCTNQKLREIQKLLQEMAYEKGLSNFLNEAEKKKVQCHFDELGMIKLPRVPNSLREAQKTKKDVWITAQDAHYNRTEKAILDAGGWSWKEDIRIKCRIAASLSFNESDYINTLKKMNIKVVTNNKGDYVYTHPEKDTWQVSGYKLGYKFSRRGIRSSLSSEITDKNKSLEEVLREEKIVENSREFFESLDIDLKSIEVIQTDKLNITLKDVAKMLEINENYDIKNKNDYNILLKDATFSKKTKDEIKEAKRTADKLYSQFFIKNKKINIESKLRTPEISIKDKLDFKNMSLDESIKYLEKLEDKLKQTGSKEITDKVMSEKKSKKKSPNNKRIPTKQQIQRWKSQENKNKNNNRNKKDR